MIVRSLTKDYSLNSSTISRQRLRINALLAWSAKTVVGLIDAVISAVVLVMDDCRFVGIPLV